MAGSHESSSTRRRPDVTRFPADLTPDEPASESGADLTRQNRALAVEHERLRTENEVLKYEIEALRETLDTIEGAVVIYDPARRFLFANQAYHAVFPHLPDNATLLGCRYEDMLRMSIAAGTVEDPAALADTDAYVARRIEDMERRRDLPRNVYNARPGREAYNPKTGRWYLLRSRRTPNGNDVTLRVDITEQKKLQAEARTALDAAERANRMKSQFLASISHELRTPLNAVINFAQLLREEIHGPLGAPQYRDYAQDIAESGGLLLTLIDELLDLARAETGHLTISDRAADPPALIEAACRTLQPEARFAGVTLELDVVAARGRMLLDPVRLRQVLINLVGNAIKFTRHGGTVQVRAQRDSDGALRITVRDTGIGIAEDDLARVFEPFARAADPLVEAKKGAGLGLPLARHLVELHEGTLTLDSQVGEGTTATVLLPGWRAIAE